MSLKTRLNRLQAEYQRRTITAMAAAQGLTYEELMEEADRFLSQSLAEQLAEIDGIAEALEAEGMTWDDVADIKATFIGEYRPL
jgi:hypothetical protein